jgi:O-antigen/teichoic acid export membrane protein
MSLTKNALSGLFWTVIDTVFLKGSIFIASIILARLLGPTEFGLVGMISVFISIGLVIVNSGLSSSLIRAKKTDESDYNTVFFLSLSISVCIFIFFYILAPYIAKFYKQQILSEVIRVYCIGFVISAFSAVQQAIFEKNMQFKKLMLLNAPGTLLGVFVGIALGILGYGVWSIVFMHLSTRLITSIMFWLFCSWKPAFQFSASKMKYHFSFGYKLLFSGLIDISFNNIYNVIIGKFFTVQSLGHFERARTFTEYPVTMLTGILDKVTYPLLSKIQDEKERVAEVYKQLLQFSFFVTAPIMFGAAAIAFPLFELILGKQWLQAAGYFQIICLASMFYPVHAFNINILKVFLEIIILILYYIQFKFRYMGHCRPRVL